MNNTKVYNEFETYRFNYKMSLLFRNNEITDTEIQDYMYRFSKLTNDNNKQIIKNLIYSVKVKDFKKVITCVIYTGLDTKFDINVTSENELIEKKLLSNDVLKDYYNWNKNVSVDYNKKTLYGNYNKQIQVFEDYWRNTEQVYWRKKLLIEGKQKWVTQYFDVDIYRYGLNKMEELCGNDYYILKNKKMSLIKNK